MENGQIHHTVYRICGSFENLKVGAGSHRGAANRSPSEFHGELREAGDAKNDVLMSFHPGCDKNRRSSRTQTSKTTIEFHKVLRNKTLQISHKS